MNKEEEPLDDISFDRDRKAREYRERGEGRISVGKMFLIVGKNLT